MRSFQSKLLNFAVIAVLLGSIVAAWSYNEEKETNALVETDNEMVMHDDVSIEVVGAHGGFKITSTAILKRKFEWNDCSLSSKMRPRVRRWYGSLGAYDPSPSFGFSLWSCEGISRTVVGEGQIHFDDEDFAREWLRRRPGVYETTWSGDGVLVSWVVAPSGELVGVEIWLMCLDGRPFSPWIKPEFPAPKIQPNVQGQSIRDCKRVSQSDIDQTRAQIEGHWNR